MKQHIDLDQKYLQLIQHILLRHVPSHSVVWMFGSRVTGNAKPYSDIDLAIDAGSVISLSTLASLSDAFVESALPYKVDVVDWHAISLDFQKRIEASRIRICP